jgi:8-oxo-dGTP pyrophosphatase MutT (NUDIX family)
VQGERAFHDPTVHAQAGAVFGAASGDVRGDLEPADLVTMVFRHTDYSHEEVGIQVPAGSIRAGESPEDAALHKARKETGLHDFTIVKKLGESDYDISPYRFEIQHRHVFLLELAEDPPERWAGREDHDGQQAPTRFECFWLALEAAHVLQSGQGALLGRLCD